MNEENDAVIRRRNNFVSIALPCFCVLMAFCGQCVKGFESLMEILSPLAFTACFGFIFSFLIDLKKKTSLNSPFKLILIVLGSGLCFFVPWTISGFLTVLVYILLVSLLCAFIGFEAGLVQLVGLCLYILAFHNDIFDKNMILNFTSILMICVIVAFADNIYKLVSSGLIYTVFYLILCYIFNDFVTASVFTVDTIAVWIFGLAVIFFMFFVMKYNVEMPETEGNAEKSDEKSDEISHERSDVKGSGKEEDKTKEKEPNKEKDNESDKSIDTETDKESNLTGIGESILSPEGQQDKEESSLDESSEKTEKQPEKQPEPEKEKKNSNLYECIEELSARLMKLESDNSVLQLMLNASVYDLSTISDPDYPYIQKLKEESPRNYAHCMKVAKTSADAAELIGCDSEEAYAIGMYIKAPKLLGDGANSILASTYKVPKHIITAVDKINNKTSGGVMTREAGIVMLTDDIFNTIYYLRSKNTNDVSIERIVTNTIRVRKEQNFLRSAGFSNEEIQLLRLYYNDLGGSYDINDSEGE